MVMTIMQWYPHYGSRIDTKIQEIQLSRKLWNMERVLHSNLLPEFTILAQRDFAEIQ